MGNTFERKLGKKISRAVVIFNCEYIYLLNIYIFTGKTHELKITQILTALKLAFEGRVSWS